MDLWPLYIPSRGRAEKIRLPREIPAITVVVEPHEYPAYRASLPPTVALRALPASHRGIGYARAFIKTLATRREQEWIWMVDDDIRSYGLVDPQRKRVVACPDATAYRQAQSYLTGVPGVALGSMMLSQYAWSAPQPYLLDGSCLQVVALRPLALLDLNYLPTLTCMEDLDFLLQVLRAGHHTMRVQHVAYSTPMMGSTPGGCYEIHNGDTKYAARALMVQRWGDLVVSAEDRYGRPLLKVRWAKVAALRARTADGASA